VVAAMDVPAVALPDHQSAKDSVYVWVVPSL
jgi:hypothetical protein